MDQNPSTSGQEQEQSDRPQPGFTALTLDDVGKMKPVEVDVDSVVYGFSSLAAYKPNTPFDVNVTGKCVPCQNIKLLQGIFGVARKTYSHIEFTMGGDPPIRVLLSIPTGRRSSEVTSDSSEDDFDSEE
ncbi:Uncharacterized protein FWK35_00032040, partial [Aphis craccivora]